MIFSAPPTDFTNLRVVHSRLANNSEMLRGGLASTKSARRSGCWLRTKVSAGSFPRLKSIPRMARFIAASRQVVGFGFLAVDRDIADLAAAFAFGTGKLTKEIFIHLTEQVAGALPGGAKADGGDHIHQFAQLAIGELNAGTAFVKNAFELGVFCLDQGQGIVYALAKPRLETSSIYYLTWCKI